jgi:tRNA-specific 2-thiouridylase
MRVAAKLDIPFLTCDGEEAYKNAVADYFIAEYKAGRTPNPDVMCNKHVKFGVFLNFAKEKGADYIATGHYAQVEHEDTKTILKRGVDITKDQSYFLWTLSQEQLGMTLLPVGNSEKTVIRKEAEAAGLLTASKKDSQGICFLGHVDIPDFLSHYITLERGEVRTEDETVVGYHKGALVYTKGQRNGLDIHSHDTSREPLYVTGRDLKKNIVYVSTHKPVVKEHEQLVLSDLNYINWSPKVGDSVEVETRYRQTPVSCSVREVTDSTLTLVYRAQGEAVSEGQSCVFYKGELCLGGGIIVT